MHQTQKAAIVFEHRGLTVIEIVRLVGVGPDNFGFMIAGLDGNDFDVEGF